MQGFRRFLAAFACIIVGGASFALSFVALRDVSVELGAVPASLGWLVPIVIDGGVICGSAVIWSLSHEENRRPVFPFLFVATLVLVSVVVNASHAGPTALAKLIAALPPLILLGTLELVASQGRRQAKKTISGTTAAASTNMPLPTPSQALSGAVETSSDAWTPAVDTRRTAPVTKAPSFDSAFDVTMPDSRAADVEAGIEAAVEEVFSPAPTWARPEAVSRETYNRAPSSPQNRRKASRVRAEGPGV